MGVTGYEQAAVGEDEVDSILGPRSRQGSVIGKSFKYGDGDGEGEL